MKAIFIFILSFWMVACIASDEQYFRVHPEKLQEAIKKCPENSPKGISCEQLKDIAIRVNKLALQLRIDPQDYGKQILALQEEIAKQEYSKNEDTVAKDDLVKNKAALKERLAVVRWLESPES
ncbi:secreted endonuclease (plasmid) [Legionella adelaidensis]|uniref:Secreted endonuclease n=1 Tax=Legionella adelaidensis TaxID=45056 RepID=A0A0W0R2H5_9GAMM|nr:hypothetical protein [Legionella adelaidensis]KTC65177.1 secreted endonuclease [Legionella adelaidensis]VEH85071.1 secreted endonuclease [Legionella adelaidensis]